MNDLSALRAALTDAVRHDGPDTGLIVRRLTRRGAARSDALVEAILTGAVDGAVEVLTPAPPPPTGEPDPDPPPDPDPGPGVGWYFMYGVSGYGGSDGYGA